MVRATARVSAAGRFRSPLAVRCVLLRRDSRPSVPFCLGRSLSPVHSLSDCRLMPAAGYRSRETGRFASVGAGSNYWSSSPVSAVVCEGSAFNFTGSDVNPFNTPGRAWGNSVRCVQHLPDSLCKVGFAIENGPFIACAAVSAGRGALFAVTGCREFGLKPAGHARHQPDGCGSPPGEASARPRDRGCERYGSIDSSSLSAPQNDDWYPLRSVNSAPNSMPVISRGSPAGAGFFLWRAGFSL